MVVAFDGVGQQVNDVVHQQQGAHAVYAGAAQNGEHGQLGNALMQTLDHFSVGEVFAGEELIHHFFAGFCNGFLQSFVEFFDNVFLAFGNVDFNALQVVHFVCTLVENVHQTGSLLVGVQSGDNDGSDLVAEAFTQCVVGCVVVGVFFVDLGDVDEAGHVAFFAELPSLFQTYGDAVLSGADDNSCVSCTEGFHNSAGEVEVTRSVNDVDLGASVFYGSNGSGDGYTAAYFFGIVVADGVAVSVLAHTVDCAGDIKQAFDQSGLTAAAVAQKADVADIGGCVAHD